MNHSIVEKLKKYAKSNGYPAERFVSPTCTCGGVAFAVAVDDEVGAAVRTCSGCGDEHAIGDSTAYLDEAELEGCCCPCGGETFEYVAAVALYHDQKAIRWVYLGLGCIQCKKAAVYADWKNEDDNVEAWISNA
jgi:hypothetical protein